MSDAIAFSKPFFGPEEAKAAAEAVASGWVVGGPRLQEFERRFAASCNAKAAVGVSSWTTGAFLVLKAWGIGPGDEVIVPSLTFIASVNVIRHAGATPVFADVIVDTYNIDPDDVRRRVTAQTKAIIAVDQIGLPCDIDAINAVAAEHGLLVLDDAACAFASRNLGRPVGSLAPVSVFSLHARKIVTTGEGGMIVTDDLELAQRLRRLRHQGMSLSDFERHAASPTTFETYPEIGYNFRITDVQAAIGLAQLDRLPTILAGRLHVAQTYNQALSCHPLLAPPFVPEGLMPNWQTYQVKLRSGGLAERNRIMETLWEKGIPTRRGVMASHQEAPYAQQAASLPVTEMVAASSLQLPMHPSLSSDDLERVVKALSQLVT